MFDRSNYNVIFFGEKKPSINSLLNRIIMGYFLFFAIMQTVKQEKKNNYFPNCFGHCGIAALNSNQMYFMANSKHVRRITKRQTSIYIYFYYIIKDYCTFKTINIKYLS